MTLGEKLRQARLEAGLSQRQLCGDTITRNMLSQIEHGSARPSMETLRYLAGRLGKSVGFFLDEESVALPNLAAMRKVRAACDAKDWSGVIRALEEYRGPDEIFDREKALLQALGYLGMAETAVREDRRLYALELLARVEPGDYLPEELERRKLLLIAGAGGKDTGEIGMMLPSLDEELQIRARSALTQGDADRAARLLDAVENQHTARWLLTRGKVCMAQGDYSGAVACLKRAEEGRIDTAGLLEICYRELGDYQQAYFYACKQRDTK